MISYNEVFYFGTQNLNAGPLVLHCVGDGWYSELKFVYPG
jgi:hypothetical protein